MISINVPQIGEQEIEAVVKVLKSGVLTAHLGNGPAVKQFEAKFMKFVNAKHAIAVNNGTAALHMALLAIGVTSGDEVILPSFTFTATAEAVVLTGAKPVFVDIDPRTYNIDSEKIEDAISAETKVIMTVDLYGLPADMQVIRETAQKHDLAVVEDSAQAHGAVYRGKPPGCFADMACWSFYASKNMTTGEGGMITTDRGEYAERLRCIRMHGEKEGYKSIMLGHNYRMPEIEAALGCVQLGKLPEFLEKRRRNARLLTERLSEVRRLELPKEPPERKHSWYLYTVRLRDADAKMRDAVVDGLRKRSVGATVYYHTPIHLMHYYRLFGKQSLPITERAAQQVFSLPVHPGVTLEQIDYIADSVKHVIR
ncbi:MAG: DegT/DnrJ/EryC1/StrS family aminotransferase [Candidatus Bathyarchaeota archaeon]|nr:MAG: DegT/DnrJ/EryC1/StrS family aminotransferase [Candidatus Bathyarchaeota archaeon]